MSISLVEARQKIGVDCHIHLRQHVDSPLCAAPHRLKPVLEMAKARDLIPCIREHAPLPKAFCIGCNRDYLYGLRHDEIDTFLQLFEEAEWPVGLEVDFIPGYETETIDILDDLTWRARRRGIPITSLAGSVHLLPGQVHDIDWDKSRLDFVMFEFTDFVFQALIKQRGARQVLDDYFEFIEAMAKSGLVDVISHLDLIRKLDYNSDDQPSPVFGNLEDYYQARCRRIVELAQQNNLVIELNMSGINRKWGRPFLHQEILNYCAELDVGVQVGSDAHDPKNIGQYFDVAYEMLMQAGIHEIVIFENRKPVKKSIIWGTINNYT